MQITIAEFERVELRIGTITAAEPNKKARHAAYKLTIDFGTEIGTKTSSAQITELYTAEQLIGRQVVCCVNLAPMHIGSVKSEVRIMGSDSPEGVVLLRPDTHVPNGSLIF